MDAANTQATSVKEYLDGNAIGNGFVRSVWHLLNTEALSYLNPG